MIEHCEAIGNTLCGLSLGHKDTHYVIRFNRLSGNGHFGLLFRDELKPMAANYNRVEGNLLEDNGSEATGYVGIGVRGYAHDVDLVGNRIVFTRRIPRARGGLSWRSMRKRYGSARMNS